MQSEARTRPLKELAREVFLDTLAAVEPGRLWAQKVARAGDELRVCCAPHLPAAGTLALHSFRRLWVVSAGKAAWPLLDALLATLGERHRPERGVVVSTVAPPRTLPDGFEVFQGGHPHPDKGSWRAGEAALRLCRAADEATLVIFLISGGASALLEQPLHREVSLDDLRRFHRALVGCGASIAEMNALRKHLSAVKGGRLAEAAARATKLTLLWSDVPEGKPDVIGSGPTLPDPSTVADCTRVAKTFGLLPSFPASIRRLFERRGIVETPKPGADFFRSSQTFILGSSRDVLHAAHRAAGARGFLAECEMSCDDQPLEPAAACLLGRLETMRGENVGQAICLISGGEVLSPVTGEGVGGRNAAFVLHCLQKIAGREVAVLSAGTDGLDGNSPAAGAVADGESVRRAQALGLDPRDYLARSDAFTFFNALGAAIVTGPTQNNLRDVRLLLAR
jgi:hydroxypyruvate reductase